MIADVLDTLIEQCRRQRLPLAQALDGLVDGLVTMLLELWGKEGNELTAPWVSPLRR